AHTPIRSLGGLDGLACEFAFEVRGDSHVLLCLALVRTGAGPFLLQEPVAVPANRVGTVAQATDLEFFHVTVDLRAALGPGAVPLVTASHVAIEHRVDLIARTWGVADIPALFEERIAESVRVGLAEFLVGAVLCRNPHAVLQKTIGPDFEGKSLLTQS